MEHRVSDGAQSSSGVAGSVKIARRSTIAAMPGGVREPEWRPQACGVRVSAIVITRIGIVISRIGW